MLEHLRGLKIKGRCFNTETDFLFFEKPNQRIVLVYGKNGSGKSTISEGLSCIQSGNPHLDLSAELLNEQKDPMVLEDEAKLHVFNEKYIDENVKIDSEGLGTIVLLGGQVNLQSQIEKQEADVLRLENALAALQEQHEKYDDPTDVHSPQYHGNKIGNIIRQDGGWAERDSKIKGNRRNTSVTDELVQEICRLSPHRTLQELRQEFDESKALLGKVSEIDTIYPETISPVSIENDWEDRLIDTLAIKINEPVLTDREKMMLNAIQNGGQANLENARRKFLQDSVVFCPYCYQEVSSLYKQSLIASINKVLNKDVDDHKEALLSIRFPTMPTDLHRYNSLDSDLVLQITDIIKKCSGIIEHYKAHVDKKSNNIYTPIVISKQGLTEGIGSLNDLLKTLEEKRKAFNSAITTKKELKHRILSINKSMARWEIDDTYKVYKKQDSAQRDFLKNYSEQQRLLSCARTVLQELQQQKANVGLAITNINNALDYVFFAPGRLSIQLQNDKFYLKSNGIDVRPKNVSVGERNILALCYFFTEILANQDVNSLYRNELFVAVDDPVSSFDFENKIGILSYLRLQASRIIHGNPKSKILLMSHDLETIFGMRKALEEICKSTKGIAGQEPTEYAMFELNNGRLSALSKKHNEYAVLLSKVYHYAIDSEKGDGATIGNSMRRVLEAFSTFNYQKSIEDVSLDSNILKSLGDHSRFFENLMYRLVLHGESHFQEQVYSIHDGNNFYQFISEKEKQQTAKHILCFIHLLNPYHLISYLNSEKNAIATIQSWINSIPKNVTTEA